ncbi:MAG TPA: hypothetical protein DEA96_01075 [Leptospiraceae bacterium]|nr:hypothetical protein [Spirochaetaceae bacterium]HBS03525.1 hypothetical protein [Leptospiraceae bacterium]|tara:strand:+ start:2870 stop:3085 length:216 start_codon:yes stop_codon:yes gene_type:complete
MSIGMKLLADLVASRFGPYIIIFALLLLIVGGWRGYACASQAINSPEEPNEVQDAIIPAPGDYDRLKLPEQ